MSTATNASKRQKVRDVMNATPPPKPTINHDQVLQEIIAALVKIDFSVSASVGAGKQPTATDYIVITIREVLRVAILLRCGLCKRFDFIYAFNGAYWREIPKETLTKFLGDAAARLSVPEIKAEHWQFRDSLLKQFLSTAYLPEPIRQSDVTLINFKNGTLEISATGWNLREHRREDFLTYQLPFDYNKNATAPMWKAFLDQVLPDKACQKVLAEFISYCFTRGLKLEKVLLLHGFGANGKSVFCDVISALLGDENISHYSLSSLSEPNGYFRARLANKLLNYGSELDSRLQTDNFKQLASGERIQARLPYGQPFELRDYAKLAFNCNELPKDVEHSEAYFRRFLVIPFEVTIPEDERDAELAGKIITNELSGVLVWVLDGLRRLLDQRKFTASDAAKTAIEAYRRESDSVALFIEEEQYKPDPQDSIPLKQLYTDYRNYCIEAGFKPLGRGKFGARLRANNIILEKKSGGFGVYLCK